MARMRGGTARSHGIALPGRRPASAADVHFLEPRPERDGDSEDAPRQENGGALEGEVPPRVGDDTADSQHGAPAQGILPKETPAECEQQIAAHRHQEDDAGQAEFDRGLDDVVVGMLPELWSAAEPRVTVLVDGEEEAEAAGADAALPIILQHRDGTRYSKVSNHPTKSQADAIELIKEQAH